MPTRMFHTCIRKDNFCKHSLLIVADFAEYLQIVLGIFAPLKNWPSVVEKPSLEFQDGIIRRYDNDIFESLDR